MDPVIYAVGDVHGRSDLLDRLRGQLRDHHRARHHGRAAEIVYVGDYVDRGPDSVGVIDRLMAGADDVPTTCLMGNHEAMMLACLSSNDWFDWAMWLGNGGDATLASLGLPRSPRRFEPDALRAALGPERIAWLRALPLFRERAPYLFVHAGVAPGIPLADQKEEDLLWIRSPFLESDVDHGLVVVHGHTPEKEPVIRRNRIGVDTGAAYGGPLTACVLAGDAPYFLQARRQ